MSHKEAPSLQLVSSTDAPSPAAPHPPTTQLTSIKNCGGLVSEQASKYSNRQVGTFERIARNIEETEALIHKL